MIRLSVDDPTTKDYICIAKDIWSVVSTLNCKAKQRRDRDSAWGYTYTHTYEDEKIILQYITKDRERGPHTYTATYEVYILSGPKGLFKKQSRTLVFGARMQEYHVKVTEFDLYEVHIGHWVDYLRHLVTKIKQDTDGSRREEIEREKAKEALARQEKEATERKRVSPIDDSEIFR